MRFDPLAEPGGRIQRHKVHRHSELFLQRGSKSEQIPTSHAPARKINVSRLNGWIQRTAEENQLSSAELSRRCYGLGKDVNG